MNTRTIRRFFKKNGSLIFSILGGIGVAATTAAAIRDTVKAVKVVEEAEKNGEITTQEKIKVVAPCYISTAVSAGTTLVCIFGSAVLSRKQQIALSGACSMLNKRYSDYTNKVKELYGKETHERILRELNAEKANPPYISPYTVGFDEDDDERLFYDPFSKRYFTSTFAKVLEAEYHINRNFTLGARTSVNDFYDFLGLEHTKAGEDAAWIYANGDFYWIDFDHIKSYLDDKTPYWIIDVVTYPVEDWEYVW